MSDTLKVEKRSEIGSTRMQKLRATGKVPAVLYGHGEAALNLAVDWKELDAVLKHSGHVVQLTGALSESALIKEVQWDHVAQTCLHVDFARVSADELVEVTLEIVLKGTAKGLSQGGAVNHLVHEIEVLCPANAIPDRLELNVTDLELNGVLRSSNLSLPAGGRVVGAGDPVLVSCLVPQVIEEPAAAPAAGAAAAAPAAAAAGDKAKK